MEVAPFHRRHPWFWLGLVVLVMAGSSTKEMVPVPDWCQSLLQPPHTMPVLVSMGEGLKVDTGFGAT